MNGCLYRFVGRNYCHQRKYKKKHKKVRTWGHIKRRYKRQCHQTDQVQRKLQFQFSNPLISPYYKEIGHKQTDIL